MKPRFTVSFALFGIPCDPFISALLLTLVFGSVVGCTFIPHTTPNVPASVSHADLRGSASWYGHPFHGRKTSNGETFNMFALTAAHRTLPFGSLVRVQRLDNGRQVDVRINDRGPFINGRVIDLSRSAADKLGILSSGTAPVRLIPLSVPTVTSSRWFILVGGFSNRKSAETFESRAKRYSQKIRIIRGWNGDSQSYHVRLEGFWNKGSAGRVAASLRRNGYSAFLVRIR